MKKILRKGFLLLIFSILFITSSIVSATITPSQEEGGGDFVIDLRFPVPEGIDLLIEILNALVAIGIAIVAVLLARNFRGSQLEKGWRIIVVSVVIFAVFEITNALRALNIMHIGVLKPITELTFVILFFIGLGTIYRTYTTS